MNPLKLMAPLQPPPKLRVWTQFCKAMLSWKVVWQPGLVRFAGQVSVGVEAGDTVKVAWQVVTSGAQVLV